MTRVRLTIEIEFEPEQLYYLQTQDPGVPGFMRFSDDGIYGHSGRDYPWKLVKKEMKWSD